MKITRRAANRIALIVATRKAEAATPKLNYDALFDGLIPIVRTV